MPKLLIIYGPTALGKTSLAVELASQYGGELVSADSRQIYQGMDIGTGKDLGKNSRKQVKELGRGRKKITRRTIKGKGIWLLDLIKPNQGFSSFQWAKKADLVISHLWQKKKLPIIVGGSAFYIKTLLDGLDTVGIKANPRLRKKLEQMELKQLTDRLIKLSPERWRSMNRSDKKNPRRLIRAIEIETFLRRKSNGSVKRKFTSIKKASLLAFSLTASSPVIKKRISRRIKQRLDQGLINEIKRLLAQGYCWADPGINSLAYKEFQPLFQGEAGLDQVKRDWLKNELAYSRRQKLWFRDDERFAIIDLEKPDWKKLIHKKIEKWYDEKDEKSLS